MKLKNSRKMPKKEAKAEESKQSHKHNWVHFLVVLIITTVILLVFTNGFSLGAGSVVRGSGSKKPDLIATSVDLQKIDKSLVNDTLLFNMQVGASLANFGEARAKASVFRVGAKGDNLENVITTVGYLDATGALVRSATTKYITITNYYGTFVDISVDPLMPISGTGKSSDGYTVLFIKIPINMPPTDGTVSETKFTFYSQADVTSVISESNENNNYKENGYIFRCAYLNYATNPYPSCCVHRVDPLSTTYTNIRGDYCEDYPPYNVLYLPQ